MGQAYSTGPCHISVALPGTAAGVYLGTAEQAPDIQIKANFEPVMNDVAGKTPYDMLASGEEGIVSVTLTRWNEPVYAALAARATIGGTRGIETAITRGTLMLTQGVAAPLWLSYPFNALGPFATLPAGYHFFASFLESPDRLSPGVRPYKVSLQWHCLAVYSTGMQLSSGVGGGAVGGGFFLYDHNMAGAAAPN